MRRFELTRRLFDAKITAQALQMDQEVHVSVFGGTRPHIGAVSVASPIGTIETTQFPGHKDGVVSGQWARTLSDAGYRPCVVAAGIHYDNLNSREIDIVVSLTQEMLRAILDMLSATSECPEQK